MVSWTPEKDKALFVHLFAVLDLKPTQETWNTVASRLGPGYTGEALRQHFRTIRRRVMADATDVTDVKSTPAKPTPEKSSPAKPQVSKASPAKSLKRKLDASPAKGSDGDSSDDSDSEKPPSPKQRRVHGLFMDCKSWTDRHRKRDRDADGKGNGSV